MNKYTEHQIEEKLKTLASTAPSAESVQRMNQNVRHVISDVDRKPKMHSFFYYALTSAAMLLIGIGILYDNNPTVPSQIAGIYRDTEPKLTRAKLNAVFQSGGHKALDDYFEMVEQSRQPRAETITLQDILKEL